MFPVRAVNQILIEPLCKSVDGCAKIPQNPHPYTTRKDGAPALQKKAA